MSPDVRMAAVSGLSSWRGRNTWMTHPGPGLPGELRSLSLKLEKSSLLSVVSPVRDLWSAVLGTRTGTRGLRAAARAWARPVSSVRAVRDMRSPESLVISKWSVSHQHCDHRRHQPPGASTYLSSWQLSRRLRHTILIGAVKIGVRRGGGVMACYCHLAC